MIYLGDKNFVKCHNSCDSLGRIWHLPSTSEVIKQHPNLIPINGDESNLVWMNLDERKEATGNVDAYTPYAIVASDGHLFFGDDDNSPLTLPHLSVNASV